MSLPVHEGGGGAKPAGFIKNSNQVDNVIVRLWPDHLGFPKMTFCMHSGIALLFFFNSRQLIKRFATFNIITKTRYLTNTSFVCVLNTVF